MNAPTVCPAPGQPALRRRWPAPRRPATRRRSRRHARRRLRRRRRRVLAPRLRRRRRRRHRPRRRRQQGDDLLPLRRTSSRSIARSSATCCATAGARVAGDRRLEPSRPPKDRALHRAFVGLTDSRPVLSDADDARDCRGRAASRSPRPWRSCASSSWPSAASSPKARQPACFVRCIRCSRT